MGQAVRISRSARAEVLQALDAASSFADLLAWSYVALSGNYARITDQVRGQPALYRDLRRRVSRAVHADVVGNVRGRLLRPSTTVKRIRASLVKYPLEFILHAVLVEVDHVVAAQWRDEHLSDGEREPRNRLFRDRVWVFEKRRSVISQFGESESPLEAELPTLLFGPRGAEDEAYALARNCVFLEQVADYVVRIAAAGWRRPQLLYRNLLFVADCVVDEPQQLHRDPVRTGRVLTRVGRLTPSGRIDQSAQRARIQRSFEAADRTKCGVRTATIVVFPELTMDSRLHQFARRLASRVTVAVLGSRHVRKGGSWRNHAEVIYGRCSWGHNKVTAYHEEDEFEPIRLEPRILSFLDTPLGRISTVICKDFLSSWVLHLIARAAADLGPGTCHD